MEDAEALLSTHRPSGSGYLSRYAGNFLLCGISMAIGGFLVVLGTMKPRTNSELPGALIFVSSFLWLIPIFIGRARGQRLVETSPAGLRWQDIRGDQQCAWEEVAEVYRGESIFQDTFRVRDLRVVLADGRKIAFDQRLSDYDRLAEVIQTMTTALLLPSKQSELSGGSAGFGPVRLHDDGITINKKRFPWSAVEEYTIFDGHLMVFPDSYKGQRCEQVALALIPNYLILFDLLKAQGQLHVPAEKSIWLVGRK